MKRIFSLILFLVFVQCVKAQLGTGVKRHPLDSTTVVRDSAGVRMAYADWRRLMASGDYALRTKDPTSETPDFVMIKLDEAAKARRAAMMPGPDESGFIKTGKKLDLFSAKDISGYKIKQADLEGKVVVLNFWFIKCAPCRDEMPELNKLVQLYSNNPNVVFIAVALDQKDDIKEFLKTTPFNYHIVDDGKEFASQYEIKGYPTNVVLGKDGIVKFHSTGFGPVGVQGIAKAIAEAAGT